MLENQISYWRSHAFRYRLKGVQCFFCKKLFYPRCYYCSCGSSKFTTILFSGRATLKSFSVVRIAPQEYDKLSPYVIALVTLEEGPSLIAQLCDIAIDDVTLGMKLYAVFRRYYTSSCKGIINYGIKFTTEEN